MRVSLRTGPPRCGPVFFASACPPPAGFTASGYLADIYSLSDYYPFGMQMRRRTASLYVNTTTQQAELLLTETATAGGTLYVAMDRYRYGFNGQESVGELNGDH